MLRMLFDAIMIVFIIIIVIFSILLYMGIRQDYNRKYETYDAIKKIADKLDEPAKRKCYKPLEQQESQIQDKKIDLEETIKDMEAIIAKLENLLEKGTVGKENNSSEIDKL